MVPQAAAATSVATAPPSEAEIGAVLGDAHSAFQAFLTRRGPTVAEWRRYSKKSPWVLKVSQAKRTLFYARPDSGKLKVTVLLGGRAVEAALAGRVSKQLRAAILEAKVFPEGRPVNVWIKRASDVGKVEELISVKLSATTKTGPGMAKRRSRGGPTRG